MDLKYTLGDSRDPKESIDVRFIALRCIVFELSAFENWVSSWKWLQSQRPNLI